MNLTELLAVRKHTNNNLYPGLPYEIYIDGYGPFGDKFNVGPSSTGKLLPVGATERFKTREEAERCLVGVLVYVRAKIKDASKGKKAVVGDGEKEKKQKVKKPSYYSWT